MTSLSRSKVIELVRLQFSSLHSECTVHVQILYSRLVVIVLCTILFHKTTDRESQRTSR